MPEGAWHKVPQTRWGFVFFRYEHKNTKQPRTGNKKNPPFMQLFLCIVHVLMHVDMDFLFVLNCLWHSLNVPGFLLVNCIF